MSLPIYQVDAFTAKLFAGNPAAVVLSESELSVSTMQKIAAENNLSETAFVVSRGEQFQIRWFTPTDEVDLCGHATLAAAHVLFYHLQVPAEVLSFSSNSGPLYVRQEGKILYLDFPVDSINEIDPPEILINALGTSPQEIYQGREDYLAIFEHEQDILSIDPDMRLMSHVPSRGVIVSSRGREVDFVSRFFAPRVGVLEDPVTGSAHTTLVPYWSSKWNKLELSARQLSKRGGELICRNLGERVQIGGRTLTYLVGEISV